MEQSVLDVTKKYLLALEAGATGDELAAFYTEDAVQEEFPNQLLPSGARRNVAALLEGAARGQRVMQKQRFELLNSVASGERVALEIQWTGTLAVPLGTLEAGADMRARFAVFLVFRGDKICRQHNYDCFDPW